MPLSRASDQIRLIFASAESSALASCCWTRRRIVSFDDVGLVSHPFEELLQLVLGNPGEKAGVGNLVAVQVQDRQHATVPRGIDELVAVPPGGERARLGFAVADDAGDDQVRVVEGGSIGVAQGIAELPALVDAARSLRRHVARDAAGEAELLEQPLHPFRVLADVRVHLAVGALQIGVRDQRRPAVPRADDVDHVQVIALDDPIQMHAQHVEPRRRPPVAQQPRLDVLALQRFSQERVVEQIDLPDRQVVGGPPIGVHLAQLLGGEGPCRRGFAALTGRPSYIGGHRSHWSLLAGMKSEWFSVTPNSHVRIRMSSDMPRFVRSPYRHSVAEASGVPSRLNPKRRGVSSVAG